MKEEKNSDLWMTPQGLFDELNQEFHFDLDLCATKENSKCKLFSPSYLYDYLSLQKNGLEVIEEEPGDLMSYILNSKREITCFMNPPYSNPKPFIEKAWENSKYCKIVCLVKCDPSTKWWSTFWRYKNEVCTLCNQGINYMSNGEFTCIYCNGTGTLVPGPKLGCEIRFFPKRIKFDPPEGLSGKSGPTFPCALVIMDRRGIND